MFFFPMASSNHHQKKISLSWLLQVFCCALFCLMITSDAWARRGRAAKASPDTTRTASVEKKLPALRDTRALRVERHLTSDWVAPTVPQDEAFIFGRDPFQVSPRLRTNRTGLIANEDIRLRARMGKSADLEIGNERYRVRDGEQLALPGNATYLVEVDLKNNVIILRAQNTDHQDIVVR